MKIHTAITAVLLALLTRPAAAEDPSKIAAELARLRCEVEALTSTLSADKEDLRARLRSLSSRKADLEMEVQREELRLKQLRETQARQKAKVAAEEERKESLKPALKKAVGVVRTACRRGLPFQLQERVADLDRLERQLDDGMLSSATVLARLWSKVEDEFRMARENGLYRQVVEIDGEEVLADVARIGMVILFFKTRDGRLGRAVRTGQGWSYRLYTSDTDRERVAVLFDAFRKRIRTGYFELPAAFPPEGGTP